MTSAKRNPRQSSRSRSCTKVEREQLIATAAYYRAQQRGFAPGGEPDDWLQAEAEVDRFLLGGQNEAAQIRNTPQSR